MKYPGILIGAATIFGLWVLRIAITGNLRFGFILWNIFLASMPLFIEPVFKAIDDHIKGYVAHISKLFTAGVWLLFLPNAFYILTDFLHLNSRVVVNARHDTHTYTLFYKPGDGQYVYDTLLLFAATAFGAYVGGLALLHAYSYLKKTFSKPLAYGAITAIMLLSAIGVYIGRFGRWNSWDGIARPYDVVSDLFDTIINSNKFGRFSLIVATLFLLQLASFLFVYYQHKRNA